MTMATPITKIIWRTIQRKMASINIFKLILITTTTAESLDRRNTATDTFPFPNIEQLPCKLCFNFWQFIVTNLWNLWHWICKLILKFQTTFALLITQFSIMKINYLLGVLTT